MPSPAALFASLIVSGVGYVAFSYGRKQRRAPPLAIGVALMVFPYFVDSAMAIYGIGAALCLSLWVLVRQGY